VRPPKKKGNPIITRYPPPPGYRGPAAQTQNPYGAGQYPNQYPPPQPGYPHAASSPPVYPNQGYSAPPPIQGYPPQVHGPPQPPNYPQQPYPTNQPYQWPQQGYPPNQGPPQAPCYPNQHGYTPPASNYPGFTPQPAPTDASQQGYGQAPSWPPPPNGQPAYPPNQSYGAYNGPPKNGPQGFDSNATPTPATAHLMTPQPPQVNSQPSSATEEKSTGKPSLFLAWDDWDFDFEGAIWPKSNEPVDPALSLGVIIWHPAKQVTRALPSTFEEAEEQALKPTPDKLDNGESVSMYFMAENSHEAFLDVRQTDEWESIRDDPIFVIFTDEDLRRDLVSLEDCIAQRDRPDEPAEDVPKDDDEEMPDASWSIMDHLEQVLSSVNGGQETKSSMQERAAPRPSQEDILASLGVTGVPKPPSDEPVPTPFPDSNARSPALPEKPAVATALPSGPQNPPQPAHSYGGHRDPAQPNVPQRPYGSMSSGPTSQRPPPPPPPPEPPRYNSWNQSHYGNQGYDGSRGSPARSEGSNHTMAGSDFEPEKPDRGDSTEKQSPPVPGLNRSDSSFSRKRSYEDADHGDAKPRQQDDHTKRKRRSQVDAAYR
ncbi:hypothetical protein EK21DRAFT_63153, partial [Setomelanomma holmii]